MIDVIKKAREWIAAQFCVSVNSTLSHISDRGIQSLVDEHYPTGFDGFHEDTVHGESVS